MNYKNAWLENIDEIRSKEFPDMYYFETLCFFIASYLKNAPVPISCNYSDKHTSFSFHIGKEFKFLKGDSDISYMDFITLLKNWAKYYYPMYYVQRDIEVSEDEDVIRQRIKEGMNMTDAFNLTKIETYVEQGVIEKIFILEDSFIFNQNGNNREMRMSGSIQKPISLSSFMKELRSFKDLPKEEKNKNIYEYILDNSSVIKQFPIGKKEVPISYSGKQMLNFFRINFDLLKNERLTRIDDFNFAWGKFTIKFENKSLKEDCIDYYEKRLKKECIHLK